MTACAASMFDVYLFLCSRSASKKFNAAFTIREGGMVVGFSPESEQIVRLAFRTVAEVLR